MINRFPKVDVLALAAHPDDIELAMGGTACLLVSQGYKVGIIDFTQGELGTRGTPEIRASEAKKASKLMGIHARENLKIPDGNIENSPENQQKVIESLRRYKPHIVFINAPVDRHPDHPAASQLSLASIFYAGLRKIETFEADGTPQEAWRPSHVLHYMQSTLFEPTLVVDVTTVWEQRLKTLGAFQSQFHNPDAKTTSDEPQTFISNPAFFDWIEARARTYGYPIGATFGEPFLYANMPLGVTDLPNFLNIQKMY